MCSIVVGKKRPVTMDKMLMDILMPRAVSTVTGTEFSLALFFFFFLSSSSFSFFNIPYVEDALTDLHRESRPNRIRLRDTRVNIPTLTTQLGIQLRRELIAN